MFLWPPAACTQAPEKLAAWLRGYRERREQQQLRGGEGWWRGRRATASPGAAATSQDGWRGYRLLLSFALWKCSLRSTLIYLATSLMFITVK
jgi:hypothetical protein